MKRLSIIIIITYAIIALCLIVDAKCQTQFIIKSVDSANGNTVFVTGQEMKTDTVISFALHYRGIGKKNIQPGMSVTYFPEGIRRRRHIHWKINK